MKLSGPLLDRIKYLLLVSQYPDRFQDYAAEKSLDAAVEHFWNGVLWYSPFVPGMALCRSSGDGSNETD